MMALLIINCMGVNYCGFCDLLIQFIKNCKVLYAQCLSKQTINTTKIETHEIISAS